MLRASAEKLMILVMAPFIACLHMLQVVCLHVCCTIYAGIVGASAGVPLFAMKVLGDNGQG
jgi:hypothetical protein